MSVTWNAYTEQEMAAFAERLKALREGRKLTQARLAELIGVNPRAYNRWERGNFVPQLDTLIKIADVLQVSLDELTGREAMTREPLVRNPKLRALCKEIDRLTDEDQQALIILGVTVKVNGLRQTLVHRAMPLSQGLQHFVDTLLHERHHRGNRDVRDHMGGVDALDLVARDKAIGNQPLEQTIENSPFLLVLEQPLAEVAERGMIERAFVDREAERVLKAQIMLAGRLHLAVGEVLVELKDQGHREEFG